jgi:hypothetical protein
MSIRWCGLRREPPSSERTIAAAPSADHLRAISGPSPKLIKPTFTHDTPTSLITASRDLEEARYNPLVPQSSSPWAIIFRGFERQFCALLPARVSTVLFPAFFRNATLNVSLPSDPMAVSNHFRGPCRNYGIARRDHPYPVSTLACTYLLRCTRRSLVVHVFASPETRRGWSCHCHSAVCMLLRLPVAALSLGCDCGSTDLVQRPQKYPAPLFLPPSFPPSLPPSYGSGVSEFRSRPPATRYLVSVCSNEERGGDQTKRYSGEVSERNTALNTLAA